MAILPFTIQISYAGTPAGTITYNAGTDTITVVGANSTHPAEFLDIYNADVAGGWGQTTILGTNQFNFACKIIIGNGTSAGTTYFADINKLVTFPNTACSGSSQREISVTAYATFTLGTLGNETTHYTKNGCSIISLENDASTRIIGSDSGSYVYLYSCSFSGTSAGFHRLLIGGTGRVWNCMVSYVACGDFFANVDVYNFDSMYGDYAFFRCAGTYNKLFIRSPAFGAFYASLGVAFNVSNVDVTNGKVALIDSAVNNYVINGVSDAWSFTFNAAGYVYRQYTFNLYVLNGALTDFVEDANVTLTHDGTVYGSWLSNSTGQIDTQTLTYGFYNSTGGDTMYGGTAWTLTITHPDWETYTSAFYPYSEIDWSISMQDTSTSNNNMLLVGLLVGSLAFLGIIVIRRKM